MEDILTDEGKRLLKSGLEAGKFLVGLGLSLALNLGSTELFIRSIVSPRNDEVFAPYGAMLLGLMVLETGTGHVIKRFLCPTFGRGIAFGGWIALLTPFIVVFSWMLTR